MHCPLFIDDSLEFVGQHERVVGLMHSNAIRFVFELHSKQLLRLQFQLHSVEMLTQKSCQVVDVYLSLCKDRSVVDMRSDHYEVAVC